jgi:hypothetical protein
MASVIGIGQSGAVFNSAYACSIHFSEGIGSR